MWRLWLLFSWLCREGRVARRKEGEETEVTGSWMMRVHGVFALAAWVGWNAFLYIVFEKCLWYCIDV